MNRKRVGILIFPQVEVLDFCGPFEVFSVTRLNENARREEFNDLLRAAYRGSALFDLARLEARAADGKTVTATWRGRTVLALDPSSTQDGAHPGPDASERIARAFLEHLAAMP